MPIAETAKNDSAAHRRVNITISPAMALPWKQDSEDDYRQDKAGRKRPDERIFAPAADCAGKREWRNHRILPQKEPEQICSGNPGALKVWQLKSC